jgi:hypothetical protein
LENFREPASPFLSGDARNLRSNAPQASGYARARQRVAESLDQAATLIRIFLLHYFRVDDRCERCSEYSRVTRNCDLIRRFGEADSAYFRTAGDGEEKYLIQPVPQKYIDVLRQ